METIFTLGQKVGIQMNPVLGPQTGIIMKYENDKYHVLCRAIFPHKWIIYICGSHDIFMPPPNPYDTSYSWTDLENLFNTGIIYKKEETSYYIRENIPK